MAKKIGDVGLALAFLVFMIGSFIFFFDSADSSIGVNTSVTNSLHSLNTTQSDNEAYQTAYFQQVDNTTTFEVQENILLDKRGTGEAGLTRENNEDTITNFVNIVTQQVRLHPLITGLLIMLLTITSINLFFRSILGEGRW